MLNTMLHSTYNKGVRVNPRSKENIQKVAMMFRRIFQPDVHKPFDILTCLEIDLGKVMEHDFAFVVHGRSYMGMTEAAVLPDKKLMNIREDVYDALHNHDVRARFTIAHEFGHLFMHKGVALNRGDGNHKIYEDSEWQANQFAAELLAPLQGCVGLDVQDIMQKYQVSYPCAVLRYKEVNKK